MEVYISYGWSEGSWHGKKLRAALKVAGYRVTKSLNDADAVIAHSGGCFMLAEATSARAILLIGLPNWSGKRLMVSTYEKLKIEHKNTGWLRKILFHIYYVPRHSIRWARMYKNMRTFSLPNNQNVILVRNQADPYSEIGAAKKLAKQKKWLFKEVVGEHDDVWDNPTQYVKMLESIIKA
jgi:hypothetical protein